MKNRLLKVLLTVLCLFLALSVTVGCRDDKLSNGETPSGNSTTDNSEISNGNENPDGVCTHKYGEWILFSGEECQDMVFTRTCNKCNTIEKKWGSEDDHVWELYTTFSSTCNFRGREIYRCPICNKTKTKSLPLLDEHSLGEYEFNSNSHYKLCSVCSGEFESEAHDYVDDKCQICGVYKSYYEITVWVQNGYMANYKFRERIAEFSEANKVTVKLTLQEIDSATASINILSGDSYADVFCFSQAYLQPLVDAGALMPLGYEAATQVMLSSSAATIRSATEDGVIYGYPLFIVGHTALLYYDKSLISEEDSTDLERLIEICEENGKDFRCQMSSGWGVEHFFLSTDCYSDWGLNKEWEFTSLYDNYNSDAGIIAAKGMMKLIKSTAFNDDTYVFNDDGKTAVLISESAWQGMAKSLFGDNLGIATLPSFTVDGKSYQLGSLEDTIMLGIKPTEDTDRAEILSSLALWLTNENSQTEYFEEYRWCPTNLSVQANEAVMAEQGYPELIEQYERSTPEKFKDLYWNTIAGDICTDLVTATTDEEILAALKRYDDRVRLLFEKGEYS